MPTFHVRASVPPRDAHANVLTRQPAAQFYKNGKRVEEFSGADERRLEELLLKHGARAVPPPPPTPAAAS